MNDIWVCATCKSINRQRDRRCYRCHEPDTSAMETTGPSLRVEAAIANRSVSGYRPAWPVAVVAGALIVAVAVLGMYLVIAQGEGIGAVKAAFAAAAGGHESAATAALLDEERRLAVPSLVRGVLTILALVAFAIWLSLVTINVPALGGGTPSRSPMKALIYPLIPILNLVKVPAMIQDVLYRVDPRAGGFFMVVVAWFGLVGSWFVSTIGGWAITANGVGRIIGAVTLDDAVRAFGDIIDQAYVLSIVTEAMIAGGAIVLVVLMGRVEVRCAARDREIRAAVLG